MLKIGEKSAANLLTAATIDLSASCVKICQHQSNELMYQRLSRELCILFLEDDCCRYYYVPSYDFVIKAEKGETLDLHKIALSVLPYFYAFDQKYDNKTKKYLYSTDTVERTTLCLAQRIQKVLDQAEKGGVGFESWKFIEPQLLNSLKHRPITD